MDFCFDLSVFDVTHRSTAGRRTPIFHEPATATATATDDISWAQQEHRSGDGFCLKFLLIGLAGLCTGGIERLQQQSRVFLFRTTLRFDCLDVYAKNTNSEGGPYLRVSEANSSPAAAMFSFWLFRSSCILRSLTARKNTKK